MTPRASFVGGIISFTAVILLSVLSLDMVEGVGFFMQGVIPSKVEAPEVPEDSTEIPCVEEVHR